MRYYSRGHLADHENRAARPGDVKRAPIKINRSPYLKWIEAGSPGARKQLVFRGSGLLLKCHFIRGRNSELLTVITSELLTTLWLQSRQYDLKEINIPIQAFRAIFVASSAPKHAAIKYDGCSRADADISSLHRKLINFEFTAGAILRPVERRPDVCLVLL